MIIEIGEFGEMVLKDVFGGIVMETPDGEYLRVWMRDGGYEISYGGRVYTLRDNNVEELTGHSGALVDVGMSGKVGDNDADN